MLTKNTPLKAWIKDFVHSKNPKFAGKSAKERSKMAQGAYYGKQDEDVEIDESRGHKILATKLRQIDTMSTGIAPDLNVNPQSTRDKVKDIVNIKKAQIVNQKQNTEKMQLILPLNMTGIVYSIMHLILLYNNKNDQIN